MMNNNGQPKQSSPSKAEMLERFVGPSLTHDQEDVEYWRRAGEELRGRTLYKLLARGKLIRASVSVFFEEDTPRLILKPRRTDKLA